MSFRQTRNIVDTTDCNIKVVGPHLTVLTRSDKRYLVIHFGVTVLYFIY